MIYGIRVIVFFEPWLKFDKISEMRLEFLGSRLYMVRKT